jgi:lactate dehydrogenase-like 2-hydroxyacid dehydrogenase
METILVTELEFSKAAEIFRGVKDLRCQSAPADEAALAGAVAASGARAAIVGVSPYRGPLYEALGKNGAAILARFGVGHDSINKQLARLRNIVVTNTPGALDLSVAEHAMWLMGCLARKVVHQETRLRAGEFACEVGMELHGKTLGILGLGGIGKRVASMAHHGFGMKVIACSRHTPAEPPAQLGIDQFTTSAEELFRASDIVSIHLPVNADTQRFVNAKRLAWLKPGALLVNTARGAVVDEEALHDALTSGRLAGAALDVFVCEPYAPLDPGKDLRQLDNVVLTPHTGSNTREANRRMAEAALQNVRCFFAGQLDRLTRVDQAT